jgi:hypothetical protein
MSFNYYIQLDLAIDLNVTERESDICIETHEEKAKMPWMYAMSSGRIISCKYQKHYFQKINHIKQIIHTQGLFPMDVNRDGRCFSKDFYSNKSQSG